jgi:cystathionine beta-lyase
MNFDTEIDRRGTHCSKWDMMHTFTGVDAPDGIAMWVADMDFQAADVLQDAVKGLLEKANYGYFAGDAPAREAAAWWMKNRHGWDVDPAIMTSTAGLGNGIGLCLQAFTQPEDEIIIFTPVYHEFTMKVRKSGRQLKQSPLVIRDGVYCMDLEALEQTMTGREKMVLFCSPHNPAGKVWSVEEMRALAEFCMRHDLLLVSDEIHHDLVMPGFSHRAFPVAVPEVLDRLIMMTSASKTFNTAGSRLGCVTIFNDDLRARYRKTISAIDLSPNLLGNVLTAAAYTPKGAEWVDGLLTYLDENRQVFMDGIDQIPGLHAMPMQATYLAWVDFSGTGMEMAEAERRVKKDARIAPSMGVEFGIGGADYMRFNIGTNRARLNEALSRLQHAFGDLQ